MPAVNHNQKGIAWIPIILIGLLGGLAVTGGAVAIGDYQTQQEARSNQQNEQARQVLKDELNQFFNKYRGNCFSLVASIGNRARWQQTLDSVILAYSPGRTAGRLAEYDAGAVFTGQPVSNYDLTSESVRLDLQTTIWHELAHVIEVDNGDRFGLHGLNPNRTAVRARNERHTEYMEAMLGILNDLIRVENRVKDGTMTADQARQTFDILRRRFEAGSDNTYQAIPSDLASFSSYTGFSVDFNKIIDLYKQGSCIKFPDGTFDQGASETGESDTESTNANVANTNTTPDTYVIWEGVNKNVGVTITTKKRYQSDELARGYSGGGLDPELLLEKKLLTATEFKTYDEAEAWFCADVTRQWAAPLFSGDYAEYQGEATILGNVSCYDYLE